MGKYATAAKTIAIKGQQPIPAKTSPVWPTSLGAPKKAPTGKPKGGMAKKGSMKKGMK